MSSNKINNKISIAVNKKLYSLEAITSAAYNFINKTYIYLDQESKNRIKVEFKAKEKTTHKQLLKIKDEFLNELLQQNLRLQVIKRNKKIREFIIGRALFSGVESDESGEDYLDDPLGIAVPWEEKYGGEK